MFRFGRGGMMGALLAALAIDSTEKRRQLDADLAEQRRAIRDEQRQAAADRKAAEQAKRSARAERRRLLASRVYDALQRELGRAKVGTFALSDLVDTDSRNRFAAQIAALVARELQKED